jgi:hypothetical protein
MAVTIDGSASVTINSGAILGITSGTAVASTSGTSIDFTSIPSWVKRITVMLSGVSLNGSANIVLQIGSGTLQTTGYRSVLSYIATTSPATSTATTGLHIQCGAASYIVNAKAEFVLLGSNTWVATAIFGNDTTIVFSGVASSNVALSGALDRVRITTVNGTDTFDAGSINILYE